MLDRIRRQSKPQPPPVAPNQFVPEAGAEPFAGYRLIQLRGQGAFATVWEATNPTGQTIALKFLSGNNSGGITAREVKSLQGIQRLSHQALLPITNVWSMPGYIVIAMPLADASLLDLFLLYAEEFNSLIEVEKVLLYLAQAAEGIDFINKHQHQADGRTVGYQHSDIKPNNILLMNDQALLADYGLATPMLGPATPCFRQGTLDYAAPEVFQGAMSDSSDQFSLAVTYYLLRTGSFPFEPPPKSPGRSYYRSPPDLGTLPYDEQRVIHRALSSAPADRFPSCLAFIEALIQVHNMSLQRNAEGNISRVAKRGYRSNSGVINVSDRIIEAR
jgi:serine/threonine protein kinase